MKALNYIIVEDERLGADMLIETIGRLRPDYQLLHVFGTVRDCIAYFSGQPDREALVFMDIELSDGQCFEIFNRCKVANPVVFTTSHDEWAIRAFKVNSVDYLLKPVEEEDLLHAIEKHESRVGALSSDAELYRRLVASLKPGAAPCLSRLLVNCGNSYVAVEMDDMAFFSADDKYVLLHTMSGQAYMVNHPLKELVEMLPPDRFHRSSRACIVSRGIIQDVKKADSGRLKIRFKSPYQNQEETVSAMQRDHFLSWYGG